MPIAPISFGRILKVNAPIYIAQNIANKANAKSNKKLDREIREIFPDRGSEEVSAYSLDGESYLLSGEHAREHSRLYMNMIDSHMSAGAYYGAGYLADIEMQDATDSYQDKMRSLITLEKDPQVLTVAYTNEDIKAVGLLDC